MWLVFVLLCSVSLLCFFFIYRDFCCFFFFFFNDPAPPEISTLPLHDALPIYRTYPQWSIARARFRACVGTRSAPRSLPPQMRARHGGRLLGAHLVPTHARKRARVGTRCAPKIGRAHV